MTATRLLTLSTNWIRRCFQEDDGARAPMLMSYFFACSNSMAHEFVDFSQKIFLSNTVFPIYTAHNPWLCVTVCVFLLTCSSFDVYIQTKNNDWCTTRCWCVCHQRSQCKQENRSYLIKTQIKFKTITGKSAMQFSICWEIIMLNLYSTVYYSNDNDHNFVYWNSIKCITLNLSYRHINDHI